MAFKKILIEAAKTDAWLTPYTITKAVKQKIYGQKVRLIVAHSAVRMALVNNSNVYVTLAEVSDMQIQAFEQVLGSSLFNAVTNYRLIKTDQTWRDAYGVSQRDWDYSDPKDANVQFDKNIDVVYCRECGMLIPLRIASIDHQAPQTGGEAQAIARLFRSLGCTRASGTGQKSQDTGTLYAASIGGRTALAPGTKEDRYTLNLVGIIYYSAILAAGLEQELKKAAMHSAMNLRPVCPPCNSQLRNSNLM